VRTGAKARVIGQALRGAEAPLFHVTARVHGMCNVGGLVIYTAAFWAVASGKAASRSSDGYSAGGRGFTSGAKARSEAWLERRP
jgi:hypothetical protein